MSLGELDVDCPSCGAELHVKIESELVDDGNARVATVVLRPVLPDHSCPPPPAREPIAEAA